MASSFITTFISLKRQIFRFQGSDLFYWIKCDKCYQLETSNIQNFIISHPIFYYLRYTDFLKFCSHIRPYGICVVSFIFELDTSSCRYLSLRWYIRLYNNLLQKVRFVDDFFYVNLLTLCFESDINMCTSYIGRRHFFNVK